MEERKGKIIHKSISISLEDEKLSDEELLEYLKEWKKGLTPEDIKSIINFIEDPTNKLIAKRYLLGSECK